MIFLRLRSSAILLFPDGQKSLCFLLLNSCYFIFVWLSASYSDMHYHRIMCLSEHFDGSSYSMFLYFNGVNCLLSSCIQCVSLIFSIIVILLKPEIMDIYWIWCSLNKWWMIINSGKKSRCLIEWVGLSINKA
jgi:hypothetical protein